jgi:hypothetical protein
MTQSLVVTGDDFHVFTWLNMHKSTVGSAHESTSTSSNRSAGINSVGTNANSTLVLKINDQGLKEDLEEANDFLRRRTNLKERISYRECPERTRQEIYDLLETERKDVVKSSEKDQRLQRYENVVDIVNAAESTFLFFLPSRYHGPTVGKFWGAVYSLLVVRIDRSLQCWLCRLLTLLIVAFTQGERSA